MTDFRVIPSVEQLRQRNAMRALETRYGRAALLDALRDETSDLRHRLGSGELAAVTLAEAIEAIEHGTEERLRAAMRPSLVRVINATGVIVHTNLGRAPLSRAALDRVREVAGGYANLEYDIAGGSRGRRDVHAEKLVARLTGAEAAVVVNNNAAATMLLLAALASGREVIISRGELVEIGGGFRVPDVMAQSGAILREVGTTNRTRAADYAAAISDRTGLILRVHPSNFRILGFTARPALEELVALGRRFEIPVAEDLGSGWLGWPLDGARDRSLDDARDRSLDDSRDRPLDSACGRPLDDADARGRPDRAEMPAALRDEPIVSESVAAGVDVVCFSGDKLLGGPQAGIIAGARAPLERIRQHPLMRALRVDKLTYAALEATLEEHAIGRGLEGVPVQMMMRMTAAEIGLRADSLAAALTASGWIARVIEGMSTIGGGSAPGAELPTRLVELSRNGMSADQIEEHLRALEPPVVARIHDDRVVLDLRTVGPSEDEELTDLLKQSSGANGDKRSQ